MKYKCRSFPVVRWRTFINNRPGRRRKFMVPSLVHVTIEGEDDIHFIARRPLREKKT